MSQFHNPPSFPPVPPTRQTSGLAIASLILAILGFMTCGLLSLVGLALGIVALTQIGKPGKPTDGKGLALAGVITSSICILLVPLTLAIMFPALVKARAVARQVQCASNMKQILTISMVYADDNNGYLPPNIDILTTNYHLPPDMMRCPAAEAASPDPRYIYHVPADKFTRIPDLSRFIILYEPLDNHDGRGMNLGFADGHIEFHPANDARTLLAKQGLKIVE